MEKVRIIPSIPKLQKKINVAAYARVSSGKDAMLHSMSQQVSYYSNLIQNNSEWNYAGVYADEALTGTKEDRPDFQRMLIDCRQGKIDLILVKSISRFARNTVTLLETVRELKSISVDVYFEEENIHSLSSDGELMLSILASYAQEESRSVSENMLWRIKKDFEKGIRWGGKDMLGYKIVNKELVVVPEEAEIVKKIFKLYLEGNGIIKITKTLNDENVLDKHWSRTTINGILNNNDYTGDQILQKTYRADHLSKRAKKNHGERQMYEIEDDHLAIISKEDFCKAKTIRESRIHVNSNKPVKLSIFSGLVKCGNCGKPYKHKVSKYHDFYICTAFDEEGKKICGNKRIRETVLIEATLKSLDIDTFNESLLRSKVKQIIASPNNTLSYYFFDGTEKIIEWHNPSRKESWTPEMKEKARQRALNKGDKKNG